MKLDKEKPSKNVVNAPQQSNSSGKGDRLYHSPEYRQALDNISAEFDSKINPGKGNREAQDRRSTFKDMEGRIAKYRQK